MERSNSGAQGHALILEVFRYLPEQQSEPWFQRYEVPYHQD